MRDQEACIRLETTAEKVIGKEINLVGTKDFNHLDLIIEAKNNRLKQEFFYIYDYELFNNCSLLKKNFNIFKVKNGINHRSARIVIHYLTKELKTRYGISKKNSSEGKKVKHSLSEIFKPSLNQFSDKDIVVANEFIKTMFPFEGCSYTGIKLEEIITPARFLTLVLSLRIIWSLLPGAIVPWKSFKDFMRNDKAQHNHKNYQSFYDDLPKFLPSYNHSCILFEFLEIFLSIFNNDYFLDLNSSIDLIFTAGQICFNRDEYNGSSDPNTDDLSELHKFYHKRGNSFYIIFIAYLRSLSREINSSSPVEFKTLFEFFKIDQFPPQEHNPVSQKALTLTIPANDEGLDYVNYFRLISNASNSTSRIYSSNHSFTKFENKFLDKFEINPHKIIENFFSKSSKNYLVKFDPTLNFDDFKINDEISGMRSNLKNNATLFGNKEFVSTFINEFNRYGFESGNQSRSNNSDTFLNDTINFNFSSNLESVDKLPVRVSKLEITEWFINSWKYETFLGFLTNTIVVKLTKTIGDCDWLIISSNDKISTNNRYLTPDSDTDSQKERELGGSLVGEREEQPKPIVKLFATPKKKSPNGSPRKKISPKVKDLKRISFPSKPNNISSFEKEVAELKGAKDFEVDDLQANNGKNSMNKLSTQSYQTVNPNQQTPQKQIINSFDSTSGSPSSDSEQAFAPPPLVKNSVNDSSLVSDFAQNFTFDEGPAKAAAVLQNVVGELEKPNLNHARQTSSIYSSPLSFDSQSLQKPLVPLPTIITTEKRMSTHPYQMFKSPPRAVVEEDEDAGHLDVQEENNEENNDEEEDDVQAQVLEVEEPQLKQISPATISTTTVGLEVKEEFTDALLAKQASPLPPPPPAPPQASLPQIPSSPMIPYLRTRKSTSHFQTPPTSVTDRFAPISPFNNNSPVSKSSKLNVTTDNLPSSSLIKNTVQSATSPIVKFNSFLTGRKDQFKKISNSESSKSLAFINDGGPDTELPKATKSMRRGENGFDSTVSAPIAVPEVPEIPYTPRGLRERRASSVPSSESKTDSQRTAIPGSFPNSALEDVILQNRGSFIGNTSGDGDDDDDDDDDDDEASTVFDSINANDSDFTRETTTGSEQLKKGLGVNIDELLEEIKEGMSQEDFNDAGERITPPVPIQKD